ncbi:P-loop containing nucleoside triphosphate hydrolase protein [Phaeosphaeriaceae sp. PMI808]|nr:P-loop containing nucleoside triphosphate hydrolase protein [Phaeosphaeriaceae sp. PMI808]
MDKASHIGSSMRFLFWGPPGTGKTLTAQMFADDIKASFYHISAATLDVRADKQAERLREILATASAWGAVLLLDEADRLISARSSNRSDNALRSNFLCASDQFPGTLIMTTNLHHHTVDSAILSKTQYMLKYELPGVKERKDL